MVSRCDPVHLRRFMNSARVFFVAVVLVLSSQLVSAQALTGYRAYVLAASGARAADTRCTNGSL